LHGCLHSVPTRRSSDLALDEPFVVVGLGPGRDSLAEVVDGVVRFGPEALLFEGADEPFGAAVGFWLTNEGGVVSDTEPGDRPQEDRKSTRLNSSHVKIS